MTTPRKLSPEQARWLLLTAEYGRMQAKIMLDTDDQLRGMPEHVRVRVQLVKAQHEWAIEQALEVIRGQHASH